MEKRLLPYTRCGTIEQHVELIKIEVGGQPIGFTLLPASLLLIEGRDQVKMEIPLLGLPESFDYLLFLRFEEKRLTMDISK